MLTRHQKAACYYARHGWPVLPIKPGMKVPANKHGVHDATKDDWIALNIWKKADYNIGVATGKESGLVVIDLDDGGAETLAGLEMDNSRLPDTVEQVTPSGGRHLFFRHPGGTVKNRVRIAHGIDVRADGGYVLVAPSYTSAPYEWVTPPWKAEPADLPGWLLAMLTVDKPNGAKNWEAKHRKPIPEGERNSELASIIGHLLYKAVDAHLVWDIALAVNAHRCCPPLPEDELRRIAASVTAIEDHRRRSV